VVVTDDDGCMVTYTLTISVLGIDLISATYDVENTDLILVFEDSVHPDLTCYDAIGMEINDSGKWDMRLSSQRGLKATLDLLAPDPNTIVIDLTRDHVNAVQLAWHALINLSKVDLLLGPAAFRDIVGSENVEISGADDMTIKMITGGIYLGKVGDVTGNDDITAYDAALILKSTVDIQGAKVFPAYQEASKVTQWLNSEGYKGDVMENMANVDGSADGVSAYDASLVLKYSAGLIDSLSCESCAPIANLTRRNAQLTVNNCDDQNLEVSIDLDDVDDVCSADIVMTYNPQALKVTDVSGASSISGWLFEHGETGAGRLRISLAGAYQPAEDGSLVTVRFNMASADAVSQLDITELRLNGGRLDLAIQNLPKSFALMQNYPNPFNPETWIPYQLSKSAEVAIAIYNMNGQMVKRLELGNRVPGSYVDKSKAAYWDGTNEWGERVASGVYFYQLQAGRDASVRKMIVLK